MERLESYGGAILAAVLIIGGIIVGIRHYGTRKYEAGRTVATIETTARADSEKVDAAVAQGDGAFLYRAILDGADRSLSRP